MRPRVEAGETKPRAPAVGFPAPPSAKRDSESRDARVSETPAVSQLPPPRPVAVVEAAVPSAEPVLVRRRFPLRVALALGIVTALLVLWHPWSRSRQAEKMVTGTAPAPTAAVAERVAATAPPVPSSPPRTRPTAAPSPVATARPSAPEESRPFREAALTAREAALRARQASERSRGQELSSGPYQRGLARQAEGERLAARGNDAAAAAAFDSAARLFGQAEASAKVALVQPSPVPIVPRAEPMRPSIVEKEPPAVTVAPPPPVHGGASDQEKIRETVRAYEKAWASLDASLYARVFPSGVANFEQSLKNIRSQSVEIQIRRIEVNGTRATVEGRERIVAQPRAGVEVRGGGDIVLRLEKRGDAWVILGRS